MSSDGAPTIAEAAADAWLLADDDAGRLAQPVSRTQAIGWVWSARVISITRRR